MNKKEYMLDLLTLCTSPQRDLFERMYPDGVTKDGLDWAISQIKRTILNQNTNADRLKGVDKELLIERAKLKLIESSLAFKNPNLEEDYTIVLEENENLKKEIKVLDNRIFMLSNPISIENVEVQERLDILSALEAGGVDNWVGYSESLEQAGL